MASGEYNVWNSSLAGASAFDGGRAPVNGSSDLRFEFAFHLDVEIGAPIELGVVGGVNKRIIPITGGSFAGPKVTGSVLPGGADWQSIRSDGTADILARYTLLAADGTPIAVTNPGFRYGSPAVMEALARGEDVDPALYYFRTAPRFEVADGGPYDWLGRNVFVCMAARYAWRVALDVYLVL